jgi:hypothetical protein
VLKEEAWRLCAANDSRPLLKAKDPIGSAESERRKRKCVDEEVGVRGRTVFRRED